MQLDVVSILSDIGHTAFTGREIEAVGQALAVDIDRSGSFTASYADGFVTVEPRESVVRNLVASTMSEYGLVRRVLAGLPTA